MNLFNKLYYTTMLKSVKKFLKRFYKLINIIYKIMFQIFLNF